MSVFWKICLTIYILTLCLYGISQENKGKPEFLKMNNVLIWEIEGTPKDMKNYKSYLPSYCGFSSRIKPDSVILYFSNEFGKYNIVKNFYLWENVSNNSFNIQGISFLLCVYIFKDVYIDGKFSGLCFVSNNLKKKLKKDEYYQFRLYASKNNQGYFMDEEIKSDFKIKYQEFVNNVFYKSNYTDTLK